ncbi:MAG: SDR family oxidoreductase [Chloroflexi bacterium]|nr:SDR family oxidoreductase [Chloroflexota bacterium]
MDLGIAGRVAIVSGGSRGIGYAAAEVLAEEGCHVAVCALDPGRLAAARSRLAARAAPGAGVHAGRCDLRDAAAIEGFVAEVVDRFGGVDILVNNASPTDSPSMWGPVLDEVDDEEWLETWRAKFIGYVRFSRAVLPHMRRSGWGRIVHVSGMGGRGPNRRYLAGGPVHAALLALAKGMADEYGPDGVLVTALSPGPIDTGHHGVILEAQAREAGISSSEARDRFVAAVPLRRYGTPREAGEAIAYLCSERAGFVTGVELLVDGGRSRSF